MTASSQKKFSSLPPLENFSQTGDGDVVLAKKASAVFFLAPQPRSGSQMRLAGLTPASVRP